MKTRIYIFALLFIILLGSGCRVQFDSSPTPAQPSPPQTAIRNPTAAPIKTPEPTRTLTPSPSPPLLLHSLYFLDGWGEEAQVWRLETDGVTLTQITHEQAGVEDFSVSSINGNLALISDNQLFLLDSDGENRRLIADDSQVDKESEDYGFRGFIENPVFSPDGQTLAYAFDGLHLYDLATGEDEHVLTNLGNLLGEPFVFVNETYTPGPWSPDGSQLLIVMGYFEGSTLAVMDTGAELSFRRIYSSGAVCCTYHWSADSRYVLVANPYYLVIPPGLWRYDANTGQETVLVTGLNEDSPFHFVGWPFQHISGDLIFFHAHLKRFSPDKGIPLIMVSSNPDGSDQTQVRSEEFRINGALWAEDGSFALILQPDGDSRQLILARTDGRPLQTLIKGRGIRKITWGP